MGTGNDQGTAGKQPSDAFRGRLLAGLAAAIEERGFRDSTVADVVRHARTSRRTFYQHFDSKEACFAGLLEQTNREILAAVTAAVDPTAPWATQVRQAVEAWCHANEARPALTVAWFREAPSLGAAARTLEREITEGFIDLVLSICDTDEFRSTGATPVSRQLAIVLLGGLRELTVTVIEDDMPIGDITEVAVDAAIALLGPRAENQRR
ncbi:TetR/AcrR family transcriptional regulator [Nocardia transvalensis]|uniref:TetR/AcrR family transcriptional regulator n=1 Tax=Nocardia transvalensis TaxID=37333 RepID=UPI0018934F7E|nr:TetR/AcrR family transcriptional regulator [Nocardia transvalensis]MBF6332013.1 TetR/AcrR family transcriptional regulator [Nocardia transvalensis]